VQLDACNIGNEHTTEKPHSRLFFHGGDIFAEIENALRKLNPPAKLLNAGIGFYVCIPIHITASVLESIGFRKEIPESNLFYRATS
jgi:hypothetical protein